MPLSNNDNDESQSAAESDAVVDNQLNCVESQSQKSPSDGGIVTSSSSGDDAEELPVTIDDLIPLIRAIIFQYPEYNNEPVQIHEEIVSVASRMEPILSTISLSAVEAACVALEQLRLQREEGSGLSQNDRVLKLFTIGNNNDSSSADNSSIAAATATSSLLEERTISAFIVVSPESTASVLTKVQWANVLLDVPMDRSGLKPHQALINFNGNSDGGVENLESNTKATVKSAPTKDGEAFIVKIQVAMGGVEQKAPMLLYNSDRTFKTFIHYDEAARGIFNTIHRNVVRKGAEGALGKAGGMKGYFYARKVSSQESSRVGVKYISVNCTELAPDQTW